MKPRHKPVLGKNVIMAPKGETITSDMLRAEQLGKDTQFSKEGGVNKRGYAPLKKRGDN